MKILVTGHEGYIGAVMVPMLLAAGHQVTGVDIGYYASQPGTTVRTRVQINPQGCARPGTPGFAGL
jgi:nucleoside-diphosphate-sugar epimerase